MFKYLFKIAVIVISFIITFIAVILPLGIRIKYSKTISTIISKFMKNSEIINNFIINSAKNNLEKGVKNEF